MPQQGTSGEPPERRYDETVQPQNPPRAVLRPWVRTIALKTYLGGLLLLFAVVGLALFYSAWTDDPVDPGIVGITGELPVTEPSPGGFDPRRTPRTTEQELRYRGVGEPRGPLAPRATTGHLVGELETDD